MTEILKAATAGKRPSLSQRRPDLPLRIDNWVERVLAIDPEQRFSSIRLCWDHLLYALEVGPHPEQATTAATMPPPEAEKIRQWLEAPVITTEAGQLGSVWTRAASALKRLVGGSGPAQRLENMPLIMPLAPATMTPSGKPQAPKRLPTMPPPLRIAGLSPEPIRTTVPPARPPTRPPMSTSPLINPSPHTAPPPRRVPTSPPIRVEPVQEITKEISVVPLSSGSFVDLTEDAALAPKSERVPGLNEAAPSPAAATPSPAEGAETPGPAAAAPSPAAATHSPAASTAEVLSAQPVVSKAPLVTDPSAPSSRGKSPKSKRANSVRKPDVSVTDSASGAEPNSQLPSGAKPARLKAKWKSRRRR
jgi:hypothetical protein